MSDASDGNKATKDTEAIQARRAADAQAGALLLKGATGDEIAAAVGHSSAREALKSASRGLAHDTGLPLSTNRALDIARTNVAISALWPRVEAGQPDAAAALAALLDVRVRLLGTADLSALEASAPRGRRRGKGGSGSGESDQLSLDS